MKHQIVRPVIDSVDTSMKIQPIAVRPVSVAAAGAIRADLLRRLRRGAEARAAYARAIELTDNAAERAFLQRRRQSVAG